jgi:hypothetical protein
MVQEIEGLINMNAQIFDVALRQDGGIHNSEWWVGRKANILVLAVGRQTVEQLGFGRREGKAQVGPPEEVLFCTVF